MPSTGKWRNSKVPKRGWDFIGKRDLGRDAFEICEMCLKEPVRYLKYARHDDYLALIAAGEIVDSDYNKGFLEVGRICLGHMIGNPLKANEIDRESKREAAFRLGWLHSGWKPLEDAEGFGKNVQGFRVAVFKQGGVWMHAVQRREKRPGGYDHDTVYPPKMQLSEQTYGDLTTAVWDSFEAFWPLYQDAKHHELRADEPHESHGPCVFDSQIEDRGVSAAIEAHYGMRFLIYTVADKTVWNRKIQEHCGQGVPARISWDTVEKKGMAVWRTYEAALEHLRERNLVGRLQGHTVYGIKTQWGWHYSTARRDRLGMVLPWNYLTTQAEIVSLDGVVIQSPLEEPPLEEPSQEEETSKTIFIPGQDASLQSVIEKQRQGRVDPEELRVRDNALYTFYSACYPWLKRADVEEMVYEKLFQEGWILPENWTQP